MVDPRNQAMTVDPTPPVTARIENQSFSKIWEELSRNPLENGDVVVPARLVGIMMAFSLAMEETKLKLTAMEAQLKLTNDSSQRLEKLEQQIQAIQAMNNNQTNPPPQQPPP